MQVQVLFPAIILKSRRNRSFDYLSANRQCGPLNLSQNGKYRFANSTGVSHMPKLKHVAPKYRLHRASDYAVVTLNGRDHYLGPWQSEASKVEYDRLVGEWLANGRRLPAAVSDLTIVEPPPTTPLSNSVPPAFVLPRWSVAGAWRKRKTRAGERPGERSLPAFLRACGAAYRTGCRLTVSCKRRIGGFGGGWGQFPGVS